MNFGKTSNVFGVHKESQIYGDSANVYRKSNYGGYSQKQRMSIPPLGTYASFNHLYTTYNSNKK